MHHDIAHEIGLCKTNDEFIDVLNRHNLVIVDGKFKDKFVDFKFSCGDTIRVRKEITRPGGRICIGRVINYNIKNN